jgi:hypothetical protein
MGAIDLSFHGSSLEIVSFWLLLISWEDEVCGICISMAIVSSTILMMLKDSTFTGRCNGIIVELF